MYAREMPQVAPKAKTDKKIEHLQFSYRFIALIALMLVTLVWEELCQEPISKVLQRDSEHVWDILMLDKLTTCCDALSS